MKKTIFGILALCLALVTAFLMPAQAIGANVGADLFLKEVRIGYGEEGKAKLEAEGYTVWQELDANKDGTGSSVYLGYITTTVQEEAITDFAVMPMGNDGNRAYSFEEYESEIKALNLQIDEMLQKFDAAIETFRKNIQKPSPYNEYAIRAYRLLNMFREDDTGLLLGELFANGKIDDSGNFIPSGSVVDEKVLHNIFMLGNATAVQTVNTALALACVETEGETFLDRLSKATKKPIGQTDAEKVEEVAEVISSFQDQLREAIAVCNDADSYEGGRDAYLDLIVDDEGAYATAVSQIYLVDTMKNTSYGTLTVDGKPLSFLDAMLLPTTMQNKDDLVLDDEMLYMLVSSLTEGQAGIVGYVGLGFLVRSAATTKLEMVSDENNNKHFDLSYIDNYLDSAKGLDPVSVYLGVDRSVFSDYENVAITDEAIRSGTLNNNNLGIRSDYDSSSFNTPKFALAISSAIAGAVAIGLTIYTVKTWSRYIEAIPYKTITEKIWTATWKQSNGVTVVSTGTATHINQNIADMPFGLAEGTKIDVKFSGYKEYTFSDFKVRLTPDTILNISLTGAFYLASIILGVLAFLSKSETPETPKVTYTKIPRAIIDVKRNPYTTDQYFVYYAAKSVNTPAGYVAGEETTALYGDLNGLNEIEPWLGLYYAKDMRLGSPITADIYLSKDGKIPPLKQKNYVPIHDFNSNNYEMNSQEYAPYNLNATSEKQGAAGVYVYFKRNMNYKLQTASIVDEDFNWLAIVTFVAGAVLAGAAVWLIAKKKFKKKAEETE